MLYKRRTGKKIPWGYCKLQQIFAGVLGFNSTVRLFHSCSACFLENSIDMNIQDKENKTQCIFQKENWLYIPWIIIYLCSQTVTRHLRHVKLFKHKESQDYL